MKDPPKKQKKGKNSCAMPPLYKRNILEKQGLSGISSAGA
jgi:hypothetical protein